MGIVETCENNALLFSERISKIKIDKTSFPLYFDWSDHIACQNPDEYFCHLNKTVSEVEKLINIFAEYSPNFIESWGKDWREQTLGAAWIHDMGMIKLKTEKSRFNHGKRSAELLFESNEFGLDFGSIPETDRIKIGLLCIRHHSDWWTTHYEMKQILSKSNITGTVPFFEEIYKPCQKLDFSGKLIATADFLRYRGKNLRNNQLAPFSLWYSCKKCGNVYDEPRNFCLSADCDDSTMEPAVVVRHDSECFQTEAGDELDIRMLHEVQSGVYRPLKAKEKFSTGYVLIRKENQVYTRGDMSLFDVQVMDAAGWRTELAQLGIGFEKGLDKTLTDEYKTVINVTLDVANLDAAMF